MENDELLKKLRENLKMIKGIRTDDGYVIYRVASIGRISIDLLKQLKTDEVEIQEFIDEAVDSLTEVNIIEKKYYDDNDYKKWIRKEKSAGNIHIFMDAINCVEGSLEVFLHHVG